MRQPGIGSRLAAWRNGGWRSDGWRSDGWRLAGDDTATRIVTDRWDREWVNRAAVGGRRLHRERADRGYACATRRLRESDRTEVTGQPQGRDTDHVPGLRRVDHQAATDVHRDVMDRRWIGAVVGVEDKVTGQQLGQRDGLADPGLIRGHPGNEDPRARERPLGEPGTIIGIRTFRTPLIGPAELVECKPQRSSGLR